MVRQLSQCVWVSSDFIRSSSVLYPGFGIYLAAILGDYYLCTDWTRFEGQFAHELVKLCYELFALVLIDCINDVLCTCTRFVYHFFVTPFIPVIHASHVCRRYILCTNYYIYLSVALDVCVSTEHG
jgi:hypothetical protein